MTKHEKWILATAIEEVKAYQDQVERERCESYRQQEAIYDSSISLGHCPWPVLRILAGYTVEYLGHDGVWRPVRFNQELDFDDTGLQDWTFNRGCRADRKHEN